MNKLAQRLFDFSVRSLKLTSNLPSTPEFNDSKELSSLIEESNQLRKILASILNKMLK